MEGSDLLDLRWRMSQSRVAFGNTSGSPETLWPIFLPLTMFFCCVKVGVTNVVAWRSASVAVAAKTPWLYMNTTSLRREDVLYYTGWSRKSYATILKPYLHQNTG